MLVARRPIFVYIDLPQRVAAYYRAIRAGATMRVQFSGYDPADLQALSRSFWNAR